MNDPGSRPAGRAASHTWLWPAALAEGRVALAFTTRSDGFNLGDHVGDDPQAVAARRAAVAETLGRPVAWLRQVHGCTVHDVDDDDALEASRAGTTSADTLAVNLEPADAPLADAQITTRDDVALAILVADCLPVLLADRRGRVVGAAHAGWRGLASGVLEATVAAMRRRVPDAALEAWLGPCIGRDRFEVGDEVRAAFLAGEPGAGSGFRPGVRDGKWWADLPALAQRRLAACGVAVTNTAGPACTVSDPGRFWSYRRDGQCGRMAALIWRQSPGHPE